MYGPSKKLSSHSSHSTTHSSRRGITKASSKRRQPTTVRMNSFLDRVINGRVFKNVVAFACGAWLHPGTKKLQRRNSPPRLGYHVQGHPFAETQKITTSEPSIMNESAQNCTLPHLTESNLIQFPESVNIQETGKDTAPHILNTALPPVHPLPRARYLTIVTLRDKHGEMVSAATLTENVIWQWNKVFQGQEKIKRCVAEIQQADSQLQELDAMIAHTEEELRIPNGNHNGDQSRILHELNVGSDLRAECIQKRERWVAFYAETAKELDERQGELHQDWKGLLGRNGLLEASPEDYGSEQAETNIVEDDQEPELTREPTPSEIAQQEVEDARELAMNLVRKQRIRLRDAQHMHDDFPNLYEHERAKRFRDGIWDINEVSQTEFDLVCLEEQRGVTAELINAEKCLNAVVHYARQLGILFDDPDQESNFPDFTDDGYRMSREVDKIEHVDRKRIENWLAEKEDRPNHSTDCDDWDSKSVDLCDSVSVVADGKEKARIQRWQAMCKEQMLKLPSVPEDLDH